MLDTRERYDVIEMIVRTKKKEEEEDEENKTRTKKSLAKSLFYGHESTDVELFPVVLNVAHS